MPLLDATRPAIDTTVPTPPAPPTEHRGSVVLLAVLSAGAAVLHFAFAPDHLDEEATHGAFFLVVGWLQLLWALAVLLRPSRRVLLLGALNLGVVAVWVVSRTTGLPGEAAEPVAFPDALATGLEVALALGAALAVAHRRASTGP